MKEGNFGYWSREDRKELEKQYIDVKERNIENELCE